MKKQNIHIALIILAVSCVLWSCASKQNTAKSRFFHSFHAKYNTYYNGSLAYIDGSLEKENGNKDNYTEMIPLYTVGNKNSKELGKGNFDRAIEKCQKAIKLHSITKRPVWDKKRRKTDKDREWLNRREYNPFLWKAWLLMGRSQFHSGQFDEAAATFSYMSRLYQTQPVIYQKARAWLAKTYIEHDLLYDAEDVIRNMQRDSIDRRSQKEWDYTMADYYIHAEQYEKAVEPLKNVIKHEMRRKQKAREWFLLGQVLQELGRKQEAYKAYKHVVNLNPPYELAFNARIAMTEVTAQGRAKQMVSKLKRMAASDNNKDYLDQVYYAMGNIYLAEKDTAKAISAYEQGNKKATRSGIERGVLLLRLGNLYWELEKFSDANRCYGEAIGLLDKDRKDYEQLSDRSKILEELVPHTEAIHLQDSLQALAKMSEKDRNAAIDRVIEAYKKKLKEEADKNAEKNAQNNGDNNGSNLNAGANRFNKQNNNTMNNGKQQTWYFYNPIAISQGKESFQRMWGKRENVDNWQRSNKTVVGGMADGNATDSNENTAASDSAQAKQEAAEEQTDSAQNNPLKREYYLAQIPFTEEQVAASNLLLQDGLFNAGVIFKDKLDNLRLSEKELTRLETQFPKYEKMAEVYYHLYLLYARKGDMAKADSYIEKMKANYADNDLTILLTDPYYKENAIMGEQLEDSLYTATYNAFKAGRYEEVKGNAHISDTRFKDGANRDKFMFIGSLNKLNEGDAKGCLEGMESMVQKFPESKLSEMAGMIINGVKKGRRLHGGSFDVGNIWERRAIVLSDSDSIYAMTLTEQRDTAFVYMWVYSPDSINENQLLFELARYNFTSYMVRNFNIEIEDLGDMHRMKVSGFQNFDEALLYSRQLRKQEAIVAESRKARAFIVSEKNLPLLGQQFSYDEYTKFYEEFFAPVQLEGDFMLNEPVGIETEIRENSSAQPEQKQEETTSSAESGSTIIPDEPVKTQTTGTTIIPDEPVKTQTTGTTIIPDESRTNKVEEVRETIIPDEPKVNKAKEVPETIIPDEPVKPQTTGTTIIPDEPAKPANAGTTSKKPQQPQQVKPAVKPQPKKQPAPKKQLPKKEPKKQIDLGDEYYDLEGF